MLFRTIRATLAAAARHFSAEATVDRVVKGGAERNGAGGGRDTLGSRLFSLVYDKRSAVIAIRKWKEEGHQVQKYQLNRVVRELRKLKRYKHALEICEWMTQQPDIKLLPGDYAVHLDLIGKIRGLASAEKFFEDLPEKMRDHHTCSALLHTYVQKKKLVEAEALMEKMSECGFVKNVLPYNHMLTLYIAEGQYEKFCEIIHQLNKNTSPDLITYNLCLSVCASQNDVVKAEKVLKEMNKAKIDPGWVTYGTLANLYIRNERLEEAASTLKEMEKRASRKNRGAYSSLLSLHTSIKDRDGLHRVWNNMKSSFRAMSDAEYLCMISSLVKLGELEEASALFSEWESISTTRDVRIANVLLAGFINRNQMEEAETFWHRLVQKNLTPSYTTWELLTWGHLKKKQMPKVLKYFKKALSSVKRWNPDERLIEAISKDLEEQGNIEGAEELLLILRDAGHTSTRIYNSLLRTYAKAGKMPLIVAERMKKDNVALDEETHELIRATSNLCVSEAPCCLS